jgi:hypothetical protein
LVEEHKVADRPHRVTVALSIIALLISVGSALFSFLGWQETKANRELNVQTSAAVLNIQTVLLDTRTAYKHNSPNPDPNAAPSKLKVALGSLMLVNNGKQAAKKIRIEQAIMDPPSAAHDGVPRLVEGQHGGQVHLTPL